MARDNSEFEINKLKNFEVANADDPESMVLATQRGFVKMLKQVIGDIKKDSKNPGLSWEQIDYLLDHAASKEPRIFVQESDH